VAQLSRSGQAHGPNCARYARIEVRVSTTRLLLAVARYPCVTACCNIGWLFKTKDLITLGGDDGTRTHDPLLANSPDPDGYERLRLFSATIRSTANGCGRYRFVTLTDAEPAGGPADEHLECGHAMCDGFAI